MDKHTGLAQEIVESELGIDLDNLNQKGLKALIELLQQVYKDRSDEKI